MKKLIYGTLFLAIIGIGFTSCEKEESKINESEPVLFEKGVEHQMLPTVTIGLTGKPYRQTDDRPRDGKDCGCEKCFGLCELGFEIGWELSTYPIIIIGETGMGNSTIYMLNPNVGPDTSDQGEFGIDQDLYVSNGSVTVKLFAGVYNTYSTEGGTVVDHNNNLHTYYSTVTVNSLIQ